MRIFEATIYQCQHCNRKMFRAHSMIKHELMCNSNPSNQKACNGCIFLEEVPHDYYISGYDGMEEKRTTTKFHCKKLEKFMYPHKAVRKGLVEKYPETFEDQESMPKECNVAKYDFNLIF